MAGRLYVCPVVGAGTDTDPQRPLLADKGVTAWSGCIATLADGKRALTWSICWADTPSWAAVDADSQCFHLTADALDAAPTNRVRNYLISNSIFTRQQANGFPTLRAVADALIQRHYGHASLALAFPRVDQ